MANITLPTVGQPLWGLPLNAAILAINGELTGRLGAIQLTATIDSRITAVAASIIASDPVVVTAAANAAAALAQSDADLQRASSLGTGRVLSASDPVWSEVAVSWDYRRVGGVTRDGVRVGGVAGVVETVTALGQGVVTVTRDYRRAQPGGEFTANGVTPARPMLLDALTMWGDSMSTDYGGLGLSQTAAVASELGAVGIDRGVSGDTPFQIAWRAGGLDLRLDAVTIPTSGQIAVTVSRPMGWNGPRTWPCVVVDAAGQVVQVTLRQGATGPNVMAEWTIEQVNGTAPRTILGGTRIAHIHTRDGTAQTAPSIVWHGRNDLNAGRDETALRAILATRRDPHGRTLVLPVFNAATESAGSGNYNIVMALNAQKAAIAGLSFFDSRAALIAHGLSIAGITPTGDDATAISEDRIPPSLMLDFHHLNVAGRLAHARIIATEITARNWRT